MGVGWVEHIYNNTAEDWYISSHDKEHNGTIRAVDSSGKPIGGIVNLDDGGYKKLFIWKRKIAITPQMRPGPLNCFWRNRMTISRGINRG